MYLLIKLNPNFNLPDGGGYFTEGRSNLRKGGDLKGHRELQKLNTQLAEQKKITEDYRGQLLAMESEMSALKDLATANKEVLKTRTKSMVDQVDLLKERYESLEKRRKQEGEGYQADIHLLKQKLKHVEHQLIRAAVNRTKGNFRKKVKKIAKKLKKRKKKCVKKEK